MGVALARESGARELPQAWQSLKTAVTQLRAMQAKDGAIDTSVHDAGQARELTAQMTAAIAELASRFPHNAAYNPTGPVGALAYWASHAIRNTYLRAPGPLVQA